MEIAFLGHQSWYFLDGDYGVLVDPLLTDQPQIYPRRHVCYTELPKLNAIFITHEHPDHFNIPTLALLPRDLPIYLSPLSSEAASIALNELGFQVIRPKLGRPLNFGRMTFVPFAPDHVTSPPIDEWDVTPFLVFNQEGHGSFFSAVDVAITPALMIEVSRFVDAVTVWNLSCNSVSSDYAFINSSVSLDVDKDLNEFVDSVLHWHKHLCQAWFPPESVLITGSGFYFDKHLQWMNNNFFTVDPYIAATRLNDRSFGKFSSPIPGDTIKLNKRKIVTQTARLAAVTLIDEKGEHGRIFNGDAKKLTLSNNYSRSELSPQCWQDLESGLNDLAKFIYGSSLFAKALSLNSKDMEPFLGAFAVSLLDGAGKKVYAYQLQNCRFVNTVSVEPSNQFVAGVEFWAADLLALFRCETDPQNLILNACCRYWINPIAGKFENFSYFELFLRYFHPLRHPEKYLRLYRNRMGGMNQYD